MAAKIFEVGDVLPATTQLKISWIDNFDWNFFYVKSSTIYFISSFAGASFDFEVLTNLIMQDGMWFEPYTNYLGDHNYIVIDISLLTETERTITQVDKNIFTWEDLAPAPSGYTITFNSNGGTSISNIEEATVLPNPLPTTTKPGYTFGGWYYESNFQTRAKAGDTIEANTTLYAKWLTLAQVLEHINNVVEELRSAIIDKGGDAEGKLLIDFATIINSLKTYEVVETLAELELLEPTLNRIVFVVEGSEELTMGELVQVTQDGDTLIIG